MENVNETPSAGRKFWNMGSGIVHAGDRYIGFLGGSRFEPVALVQNEEEPELQKLLDAANLCKGSLLDACRMAYNGLTPDQRKNEYGQWINKVIQLAQSL